MSAIYNSYVDLKKIKVLSNQLLIHSQLHLYLVVKVFNIVSIPSYMRSILFRRYIAFIAQLSMKDSLYFCLCFTGDLLRRCLPSETVAKMSGIAFGSDIYLVWIERKHAKRRLYNPGFSSRTKTDIFCFSIDF